MKWKSVIVYPAVLLMCLMMAVTVQAKKKPGSDTGDTTEVQKHLWMTGTVSIIELYELKETLYAYDYDYNVWVETLIPAAEPDQLYFLTIDENQNVDGDGDGVIDYELKKGDQWLLDFGPEWYSAAPCLTDSYICPGGGVITTGPYVMGDFVCDGTTTESVKSNDVNLDGEFVALMSRTRRDALPDNELVYAFGRSGGSEAVWIWDPDGDGVYEVYDKKVGVNIIWEMADEFGTAWWRGDAPPQAMTNQLSCSVGG